MHAHTYAHTRTHTHAHVLMQVSTQTYVRPYFGLTPREQAIHHVVAWRGPDDTSAWSLLARLWREEEKEMGVPREYMGTLAGTAAYLFIA